VLDIATDQWTTSKSYGWSVKLHLKSQTLFSLSRSNELVVVSLDGELAAKQVDSECLNPQLDCQAFLLYTVE
jgi:hypothetical protein